MAGAEHLGCRPRSLFLASQSVGTAARAPETAGLFDRVYAFEPVPAELEPQYAGTSSARRRQKGPENVEYQAFPRLSALAEVVWTPADRKQYEDYLARLGVHHGVHQRRLEALDVNFRPLDAGAGSSRP